MMFNILLSISVCAAASLFLAWLMRTHINVPYVIAGVVDLSLHASSNVTLENVAVLGECCPAGRDSSLNRFVLVYISGAV